MKKTWFHRLLLSYFPILLVTVSVLIFISISMLSEYSIKATQKANAVSTGYVIDSVHSSLKGIEEAVLDQINKNEAFYHYFEPQAEDDPRVVNYEASQEVRKIIENHPLIHSIYLYRAKDGRVLTKNEIVGIDQFGEQAFIRESLQNPQPTRWTLPRDYAEFGSEKATTLVSMNQKALLPFGNQGLVVINVRLDALMQVVDQMINRDITFMHIVSDDGKRIYPIAGLAGSSPASDEEGAPGKALTERHSEYLGWSFISGIKGASAFGWVSAVSRNWFGFGVLTVLLSIIYTVYVTRKNYKPIENIMSQIQTFQSRNKVKGSGGDEFSFIERVLENLMNQSIQYEEQYQEDLLIRRKQFFQELIEGRHVPSPDEWDATMSRFQMKGEFTELRAGIVEIDDFAEFQETYNRFDQNLLKFAVTNVSNEFSDHNRLTIWAEWISDKRMTLLLMKRPGEELQDADLYDMLDKFRTWVAVNLKFSVTVGTGRAVRHLSDIRQTFHEAEAALHYKMSLGGNQVIRFEEIQEAGVGDTHKYFQLLDELVRDFRISYDSWELQLDQLAEYLAQDALKSDEVRLLLRYAVRLFQTSMEALSPEVRQYWQGTAEPTLTGAIEREETLEKLLPVYVSTLKQVHRRHASVRDAKSNRQLITQIRKYIEENYANPDLSLNLISDTFNINAKYSSQLFKEEFGMKFVDFLVNLRMEEAKKLLLQTDHALQDISERVGYTNSISFGRTFKKTVGVTPGDYRKHMQQST